MLKNLFRPKWQHENPEIRKTAINNLSRSEHNIIEQIALSDIDQNIRHHALSKLENLTQLERIIEQASTQIDQDFALKCWVSVLINSGQLSPVAIEEYILDCPKEKLLTGIIAYSDNDTLRDLALSGIKQEAQLLSLMQSTKNGRVWQTIINKLESEDVLKQAFSIVNGRDKKSQQTIKNKLENIKHHQLEIKQLQDQTNHLINKLQHLAESDFNPLFEGILLKCKQHAAELKNTINTGHMSQIESLVKQCEDRLNTINQTKVDAAKTEHQEQLDYAAHFQLLAQIKDLKTSLFEVNIDHNTANKTKSDILNQWRAIQIPASANQEKLFKQEKSLIDALLNAHEIISKLFYIEKNKGEHLTNMGFTETQKNIDELGNVISTLNELHVDIKTPLRNHASLLLSGMVEHKNNLIKQEKTLHQHIKIALNETENFIDQKDLKNAQKMFAKARKALGQLPEVNSKIYGNTTQRLFNAIKTLDDWKNYAADEKREELCALMKALITNDNNYLEKAEAIKELQHQWKSLGHCQNQDLWKQFKTYADEAYLPCQAYFDQQKKIRQFNLEQRIIICEQIETLIELHDWDNANWKALDHLLKSIQDEWKKYSSVERDYNQKLQDRFYKNLNILKEKINTERKANTEKLHSIVDKANALLSMEDIKHAIELYSQLQQEWKNIGITSHKEQHNLWLKFRKTGDSLFEKRQNIRQAADIERKDNLLLAQKICNDIIALSQLNDTELGNSRNAFDTLKAGFNSINSLPNDQFKLSLQAFEDACNLYNKKISGIGLREWKKQLTSLITISNKWNESEENGVTPSINFSDTQLPEKWLKQLSKRFSNVESGNPAEQAKLLCIEMELLANTDTPEEDSSIKMRWQMENLAKNFGKKQENTEIAKLEDLYIRWYSQKCWDKKEYQLLEKRFLFAATNFLENI